MSQFTDIPAEELRVLVLGGGPDAERDVSLASAEGVASALREAGCQVVLEEITTPGEREVARLGFGRASGEVIFPVLHGPWGEGGGLQRLLEADGRAFVGSKSGPARAAMDKVRTKQLAAQFGISTLETAIVDPSGDGAPPLLFPFVVKPVADGSTIGLHLCRDRDSWMRAWEDAKSSRQVMMAEPMRRGRELTVGAIRLNAEDRLRALPVVEITPAETGGGLYDFAAKYERGDTIYAPAPELPEGVAERISNETELLAALLGVRHLCRADFILDGAGTAWLLELNTMPGFTRSSLLPMAAAHAGIALPELCVGLVRRALLDSALPSSPFSAN